VQPHLQNANAGAPVCFRCVHLLWIFYFTFDFKAISLKFTF